MAASVTANLSTFDLADSATGWTGTSGALDTEVFVQNTGSWAYQTSKNSRSNATFTHATSVDMSAADTHIYFWMRCDVMPFCEVKTTGTGTASGLTVRVESSATDYEEWHVAGSDTWGGEWKAFVVDINDTAEVYASGGTLSRAAVNKMTWFTDNSNSGNIRIIDNTWLDAVRFGTGLTVTGTAFDFTDIAADDNLVANKYGILSNINGVIFAQGRITIGSGATTTTFTSDNETLVFVDGFVSSGLYQLNFVGSGNTSEITSTVIKAAGTTDNARFVFDADDTNITFTLDGASVTRAGLVTFAAGDSVENNVFNDCFQIDPSTVTFENNTVSNYVGTEGGALLWPGGTTVNNCNFINNDEAVEIASGATQTFDALTFDDVSGKFDVNNTTGSGVTVSKTNSANPNSYTGSTVTFTASYDHILVNIAENTEVTYVKVSDGSVLFHVENVTASGSTTYNHTGVDTVDILIHHLDYLPDISGIYNLALPASPTTVQIQQFDDPNYYKP